MELSVSAQCTIVDSWYLPVGFHDRSSSNLHRQETQYPMDLDDLVFYLCMNECTKERPGLSDQVTRSDLNS